MKIQRKKRDSSANIVLILFAVAIYASSGYFSKSASFHAFLSLPYLAYFSGVIIVLSTYAVLWQKILQMVPLSQAYLYKSFGLVFGLMIAHFVFHEGVSIQNMIGCGIVFTGIITIAVAK
jgi:drug/metabolite transporter (DMT)-like permease